MFSFVISSRLFIFERYKNEFFGRKKKQKNCFKNFYFNYTFIKKPKVKGLKKTDLLQELRFYDELNVTQISKVFGWYARNYKVEIED